MEKLYVIKIGGNIIDDEKRLISFLENFSHIQAHKILVHGGGSLATLTAETLGIAQQMVDGRRITDAETLKVVTMVYAGYINKNIVARLHSFHCNAIGISGADGNAILAHKRAHAHLDYGFAGDVDEINTSFFSSLLDQDLSIIVAPVTHDKKGQLLNTNADTIAQEIAKGMSPFYDTELIYTFEKSGVLMDVDDEDSVLPEIGPAYYQKLKEESRIFSGMIPKLDNAFSALKSGVRKVIIGKAEELDDLIKGNRGTAIINEETDH
jgi:acetylglutamate kinase